MASDLILKVSKKAELSDFGNKARNLAQLIRIGRRVPKTFILRGEAYRRFLNNDIRVIDEICAELERKVDLSKKFAVRSSANIEDQADYSFAGQFTTVLNVKNGDAILQAVRSIWATTLTPEVQNYLKKMGRGEQELCMAVIIQEMVEPFCSGVAFSRNPTTGKCEIVVEAVRGLGTALVQDGFTPYRWIYQHEHFRVKPAEADIPQSLIKKVVDETQQIAHILKRDVDLEWVFDGEVLFWVQMRDITTHADIPVYSHRIAREMLPGMLKPLIWSVNIQLMIGDKIRLITEMLGPNRLDPQKLVRQFYYRAYFNMSMLSEVLKKIGFQAESIEMMLGMNEEVGPGNIDSGGRRGFRPGMHILRYMPYLLRFLWKKWRIAPSITRRLPEMETKLAQMSTCSLQNLTSAEIIQLIDDLYELNKEIAYDNVVIQLSAYVYNMILISRLKKMDIDTSRLDMHLEGPDFNRFDPNYHLELLHQSFFHLEPDLQEKLKHISFENFISDASFSSFRADTVNFLLQFGHLSDNGHDFSTKSWREDADGILRLVIHYVPHKKAENEDAESKLSFDSLKIPIYHRWILRPIFQRTTLFRQFREHASYIYTFGISLFRVYFLELARRFVKQGLLDHPEDIFYLEFADIRQIVIEGKDSKAVQEKIVMHKVEMERVRNINIPTIIYGDQAPPVYEAYQQKLYGTATSSGYSTAKAKVVNGLADFTKIEDGDILVIPYSDVSWTPLFARAGGIIAEAGGMLSHSSIVAREYGIPAVVSVAGAMQICDGTLVSIDGFTGEISIHSDGPGVINETMMGNEKEK